MKKQPATESEISLLKTKVEQVLSKKMRFPSDFDFLSGVIWDRTHESVSSSTLKRIWGYVGKSIDARESTLDIISRFLNYKNWDDFVSRANSPLSCQSGLTYAPTIRTQDLQVSQKIELQWAPDRRCVIEYMGGSRYKVLISENTSLQVDDTFCCGVFVLHEAALLDRFVSNFSEPVNYIIGSQSGLSQLRLVE